MDTILSKAPERRQDDLKLLALATMLIDHIGLLFFPGEMLFRTIGRIAFPIFAWQLAEGYFHTSNRSRYMSRVFLFGCLAQIPYMFMSPALDFAPMRINILFQLFSGLLLMASWDSLENALKKKRNSPSPLRIILPSVAVFLLIALPDLLEVTLPGFQFSYGTYGQLMMLLFYKARKHPGFIAAGYCLLSCWHSVELRLLYDLMPPELSLTGAWALASSWLNLPLIATHALAALQALPTLDAEYFQSRSLMALPLIFTLSQQTSRFKLNKWVAYGFYPAHIAVLLLIRWAMNTWM